MREVWENISGFEGFYQISNLGRIKSFHNKKDGIILSVKHSGGWYLSARLSNRTAKKTFRIHRLVAEHFIPNPENKTEVNHKDRDKQNNDVSNLEWVTSCENMKHAVNTNPSFLANMINKNKYGNGGIIQLSTDGKFISCYTNAKEAAEATGVCRRNILQVAYKEEYKPGKTRKQAGGYVWELAPLISFD